MKEATGEGSMTVITIVIIVGIALGAAVVIAMMMNKASSTGNDVNTAGVTNNVSSTITNKVK